MADSLNRYGAQTNTLQPDNFWDFFNASGPRESTPTDGTTATPSKKIQRTNTMPFQLEEVAQRLAQLVNITDSIRMQLNSLKEAPDALISDEGKQSIKAATDLVTDIDQKAAKIIEILSKKF